MTIRTDDEPAVVIDHLTKRYGEITALDDLSLEIPAGKILGFIGPNGAGKTTTIRILVGLARPTSGRATIAGADCVRDAHRIKRLVGYMPDGFASYDNMRVREYLDFFAAAFQMPPRSRKGRIDQVLEIAGATYMQDRFVESLSHGMQQRVGLARTLLHDPQVLICDEPANGLDPQARIEMRELLLQLAQMGKTLIVTSHILPELARICDLVAIVTHGRLRAFGTLDQIMRQLRQRRILEIQLAAADQVEQAARVVAEQVEADAEIMPAPAEAIVRVATSMSDEELPDLLSRLLQQGLRIAQFRELQTDLEDAFLSVTRQENAAAASEEATT